MDQLTNCGINLDKLAVISAIFVVIGDVLALIVAILTLKENNPGSA